MVGGLFTNSMFGFFRAYTFIALFAAAGSEINGFDLRDTLTYAFVTQSMLTPIALFGTWDIATSIRTGAIVTDLFRPYDYQLWWLAQDLGRATYHAITRGIVPFVAGALVFELRVPEHPATWLIFLMSMALAVMVSFGLRFIVNVSMFWIMDHRGVGALLLTVWSFFAGFIVPITFFPGWLRSLAEVLPFIATIQLPIEIFLEKQQGAAALGLLAFQLGWALALLGAGRALLAVAARRVVTHGG